MGIHPSGAQSAHLPSSEVRVGLAKGAADPTPRKGLGILTDTGSEDASGGLYSSKGLSLARALATSHGCFMVILVP